MLINRASCSVFRAALGHESAGVVNGPGLRLRGAPIGRDGLRISGGAPIFDLRARSGVLAILRSINCRSGDGPDPRNLREQDHVFADASQRDAAEIVLAGRRRVLEGGQAARSRGRRHVLLFGAHDRRLLPAVMRGAAAAARERGFPQNLRRRRAGGISAVQALSAERAHACRDAFRGGRARLPADRRSRGGDDPEGLVRGLQDRFPNARLVGGDERFERLAAKVVGFIEAPGKGLDLPLDIRGTAFQQRVWTAIRDIPAGSTASYREIAERIGAPKAVRAVAQACASNDIAVAIPCHRVVRMDGSTSGYRWGVARKRALLARDKAA